MTERTIRQLGESLGVAESEILRYVAAEKNAGGPDARAEMERLTSDTVELLADWHHFAILELCGVEGFEADSRWIARALDLEVDEVNMAVQRLLRLGLMRMEGTRWIDTSGEVLGDLDAFQQAAIHRLVTQLRDLSMAAITNTPSHRRAHTVATLSVSTSRLSEAFALIERMRLEIGRTFESEPKDDVYKLEINFFPVTTLGVDQKET